MRFVLPVFSERVVCITPRSMAEDSAMNAIARLDQKKSWIVEITEKKPGRSLSQNRMLWSMYADILRVGGETLAGWDKDDLHEYCLGEFSGWEVIEVLGRKRQRPIERSSKMDKATFTKFIDFIQRKMAGHGIVL